MLPEPIDIATLDLSFISVLKVMPAVSNLLAPVAQLVILIKPQFEAERHQIRRGGLVSDPAVHQEIIARVVAGVEAFGFKNHGVIESPIKGAASGNTEFLGYFTRS
jgi:23S rRNA (cytidine1920-2'-O)/16S rRNA (cytidine1409-2'-O)-methyltransferase